MLLEVDTDVIENTLPSYDGAVPTKAQTTEKQLTRVAVFHYPPFTKDGELDGGVMTLLKKYKIWKLQIYKT